MGGVRDTHVEVLGVDLAVFGEIEVFLCHEHSLCVWSVKRFRSRGHDLGVTSEEILVDFLAISFRNKPDKS